MYYKLLTRDIKTGSRTEKFEDNTYTIFWEGLIFIKGLAPGEESLIRFIEELKKVPLNIIVEKLSGVFACIICDKKKDTVYNFVDNSGLFSLFYSPNFISTSFLKIVEISQLRKTDINPTKYTDIVAANAFMKWETYFDSINRLRYDEILVNDGSEMILKKKKMRDLFKIDKFDKTIIEQYEAIAESLKKINGRISFDLSGGLDTRMNCVVFKHHGLDFETAISGMPGNLDVEYSKKVAEALGTKHYISYHSFNTNELKKDLEESFWSFEPLQDIVIWQSYLPYQKDKLRRNCILTVTGHAGELYKNEFIWNLDNRNPKKAIDQMLNWGANIRYGTDLRHIPHGIYTENYIKYSKGYGERLKEFLIKNFGNDTSGKVGAKIYTYFHEASRSTNMGPIINRFSPLLDRDLIPCGITLKTTANAFKRTIKKILTQQWNDRDVFESRVITSLNKKVAKAKITSSLGLNASTKRIDRIRNLLLFAKGKIIKPKLELISSIHPEYYPAVRSLNKTQEMFEILKNEGILNKKVKIEDVMDIYLGSLFTIGRFIEFCDELK
ncbi:hypothetical protein LCGC14_1219590 [marine sediment metagenome]|uniref:Asparagine synthetase domain-containing protein n=1 Tax=marine sediment metagenome TaxID=412755 RepID=A0A0F9LBT1_9ZZZZ